MLKVILDTNIIISGLLKTSSNCRKIINKLSENKFTLIISPTILEEFIDVTSRPKFHKIINRETAEKLMELIKNQAFFVNPSKKVSIIKNDLDDNMFLEAALEASANFIISGDEDLLALGAFHKTKIIPPKEFLKIIAGK